MNRREAVQRLGLLFGGVLSTQLTAAVMGQVLNTGPSLPVSASQEKLIDELADVIIPTTDTPGAKEAGVGKFIVRVIRDCHRREEQQAFYDGLERFEAGTKKRSGKSFVELSVEQKNEAVKTLIKENKGLFLQMRQLTITGYFTSEIGATKVAVYLPIPGKFEGDVPMKPGQKVWAI
ncbi:MAG: gluconate 2-dehydrogenase subunit 3 family protein [Verrucomicrobia bacterium]|nr:gluconate 2-dehydrogenase subunit 3 family protein [Verrucomicrobiota bacterium]